MAYPPHARGSRSLPDESRVSRQRQREPHAASGRTGGGWRDGLEAARGLGHDAGDDRRGVESRRFDGRPGVDPYRYAQRVRFCRDDIERDRRPHHPHLSHRGRRRRSRTGHHQGLRRAQCPALVDQSDTPLHSEHHRRASRHAHGLPPPRPGDRRRHRFCRIAHSARDHRRRGHPSRSGRVFDDLVGLASDGPRGRSRDPDLANRAQDENAAGLACAERRPSPLPPLPGGEGKRTACCAGPFNE